MSKKQTSRVEDSEVGLPDAQVVESPQAPASPAVTARDALLALAQHRAWERGEDYLRESASLSEIESLTGIRVDTLCEAIRRTEVPGVLGVTSNEESLTVSIDGFCEWLELGKIPCEITPDVAAFVDAVRRKAEMLRRHATEKSDADAACHRLRVVLFIQQDERVEQRARERAARQAEQDRRAAAEWHERTAPIWQRRREAARKANASEAEAATAARMAEIDREMAESRKLGIERRLADAVRRRPAPTNG
jgi:hypothetical protein